MVNIEKIPKITEAFNSILRADYVDLSDLSQLKRLEDYYVDYFNMVGAILQNQDNFVGGRRGSGKTVLLLRGYYECLKTISPKFKEKSHQFGNKKILPIFIDLSNCNDIFLSEDSKDLIEIHFVRQIIDALKRQIEVMFDKQTWSLFKKENPALDDLEFIEKVLVEGLTIIGGRNVDISKKESEEKNASIKSELSSTSQLVGSQLGESKLTEITSKLTQIKGLNIQEFYNKINDIRKKAKIDSIMVFIDEFSDLNNESQKKFSTLLQKLLGSKINMFYKLGVITDRYDFGDKILIGRDLFQLPLDLNDHVERYGGTIPAIKKMQEFVEAIIDKRLEVFCPEIVFSDIFKISKNDLTFRLARESLGVTRTIGLILQNAWIQSQANATNNQIGLNEINYGIRSARRNYYNQFQGAIKKKIIPGFFMDLWSDLLNRIIEEKNRHPDRPASHFLIDPVRKNYLNLFCENFLIHFLEENRTSKYGGKYNLYCLDFDICMDNSIKFAEEKDQFTAARFIYDSVLSKYDAYFQSEKIKSYRCDKCGKIYSEDDVVKSKVKRCFDCDEILKEIVHKDTPKTEGNYAEVETKILGIISMLNEETAMYAQEIADAVGCSRQKVALWGSRVLAKQGLIKITHRDRESKNYYYDA